MLGDFGGTCSALFAGPLTISAELAESMHILNHSMVRLQTLLAETHSLPSFNLTRLAQLSTDATFSPKASDAAIAGIVIPYDWQALLALIAGILFILILLGLFFLLGRCSGSRRRLIHQVVCNNGVILPNFMHFSRRSNVNQPE